MRYYLALWLGALALIMATAAPAHAAHEVRELRIGGFGLAAGTPGLHPSSTWTFGMPRAEIVAAVAAIRGRPNREDSNSNCGAGPMQFAYFGPLVLNFLDGRWVGWELLAAGTPPIRTEFGTGIGTSRAELEDGDDDEVRFEDTHLGTEFTVEDLHGLLTGPQPDATVAHLWAGTGCTFPG